MSQKLGARETRGKGTSEEANPAFEERRDKDLKSGSSNWDEALKTNTKAI